MYDLFTHTGQSAERSPLQFAKFNWLKTRILDNHANFVKSRLLAPGRVQSNHLVANILSMITATFSGDLIDYLSQVEGQVRRIAGTLELTSGVTRGKLHKGVFYKGCDEIVTVSGGDQSVMDLWADWRSITPVTVLRHPVTSMSLFDPLAMDSSVVGGFAMINVDIPLLAAQYLLYKSNHPSGTVEGYISQVIAPGLLKSHIDVTLFNRVLLQLGVLSPTVVKTNLPFAQSELDTPTGAIAKDVVDGMVSVAMTAKQLINTIPTAFASNMLKAIDHPPLMAQQQALWALHTQAVEKALLTLGIAQRRGHYDRLLQLLVRIGRDNIQLGQEGWYRNGQNVYSQGLLMDRWGVVLAALPNHPGVELEVLQLGRAMNIGPSDSESWRRNDD